MVPKVIKFKIHWLILSSVAYALPPTTEYIKLIFDSKIKPFKNHCPSIQFVPFARTIGSLQKPKLKHRAQPKVIGRKLSKMKKKIKKLIRLHAPIPTIMLYTIEHKHI